MKTGQIIKEKRKALKLTLKEIADYVGVSEATVSRWESGNIANMGRDKIASLSEILKLSPSVIAGYEDTEEYSNLLPYNIRLYPTPIFENVSAGFGTMAIDSIVDYTPLPFTSKSEAKETICIRVKGDSMSPDIQDGDLIQVHKQSSVDNYDIAVVLLDGDEGFVKKVEYGENYIKLISLNPGYKPIVLEGAEVERCSVVGKVKKVIRDV